MTFFAIARTTKLKGNSIALSERHSLRLQPTPNANPESLHENRLLLGEARPLREQIDERINLTGARTRKDNVECVEYMLTATREFFLNEQREIDRERLAQWMEKNIEFLLEECGPDLIAAGLHRDERTPHFWAYRIPLVDGKLNYKLLYGGPITFKDGTRGRMRQFQDRYAAKMEPLGLERGVERSRARHTDIEKFYGTLLQEVTLTIDEQSLPDPPQLLVSKHHRQKYKKKVIAKLIKQLAPKFEQLRNQAMLTLEETRKREAAEARAEERVAAAERRIAELGEQSLKLINELHLARFDELTRNEVLEQELSEIKQLHDNLYAALGEQQQRSATLTTRLSEATERVTDIPLDEVIAEVQRKSQDRSGVNFDQVRAAEVEIKGNKFYHRTGRPLGEGAMILVKWLTKDDDRQALLWLTDKFGTDRAIASAVVVTEQTARQIIQDRPQEWERATSALAREDVNSPQSVIQQVKRTEEHERSDQASFESYGEHGERSARDGM